MQSSNCHAKTRLTHFIILHRNKVITHTLPIGDYTRDQVREIASKIGITVAKKPDSMEICFIPDNDYAGFITRETGYTSVPGNSH